MESTVGTHGGDEKHNSHNDFSVLRGLSVITDTTKMNKTSTIPVFKRQNSDVRLGVLIGEDYPTRRSRQRTDSENGFTLLTLHAVR